MLLHANWGNRTKTARVSLEKPSGATNLFIDYFAEEQEEEEEEAKNERPLRGLRNSPGPLKFPIYNCIRSSKWFCISARLLSEILEIIKYFSISFVPLVINFPFSYRRVIFLLLRKVSVFSLDFPPGYLRFFFCLTTGKTQSKGEILHGSEPFRNE